MSHFHFRLKRMEKFKYFQKIFSNHKLLVLGFIFNKIFGSAIITFGATAVQK